MVSDRPTKEPGKAASTCGAGGEPVRLRLRQDLERLYGDRLERAVLFGSRARGDARPESDFDVAVFVRSFSMAERSAEMGRLVDIETAILFERDAVVSAMPFPAGAYENRTMLMHEIRCEGVDL